MFDNFWIISSGIGFLGGWISCHYFESIFREGLFLDVGETCYKELSNDKKNLTKLVKKQARIIKTLTEKQSITPFSSPDYKIFSRKGDKRIYPDLYSSKNELQKTLEVEIPKMNSSKTEKELANIFEEEHERSSKTVQEKLDVGRKIGNEPISFFTSKEGGYVTFEKLKETQEESSKFRKEGKLKRADELEIMHSFNEIRGMKYYDAQRIVNLEDYTLYPIYVNRGKKIPRDIYSGTVLGVSISDSLFNYKTHQPSTEAVITCIVDVGGQDSEDRETRLNSIKN